MRLRIWWALSLMFLLFLGKPHSAQAQGTAFLYQGRLNLAGTPANGLFDIIFLLYTSPTNGTTTGAFVNASVPVTNGLFTVSLDFGNVFNGTNYWLELRIRTNSLGAFTVLTPRQPVLPTPYAVTAGSLAGVVSGTNLAGTYPGQVAFNNSANTFNGSFAGNGGSLTNLNASNLTSGTVPLSRLSGITSNQLDAATDAAYRTSLGKATNTVPVINVQDYGAGIGGNDSVALLKAFKVWTNVGGTLYFPAGVYTDNNTYKIGPDQPNGYDGTLYYPLTIAGDGKGSSLWRANIANSTFITAHFYVPTIRNITIQNIGTGTNTGFYTILGGPVKWDNVRFIDWTWVGADMQGIAGGAMYECSFVGCRVGLRVPGFCDGWTADLRVDANTLAGVEMAGIVPSYPGVRRSMGGRWHITGANNYIAAIVGEGWGHHISGYIENSTNCTVAVGHPPESNDPDTDVGSVSVENMGVLQYQGGTHTQALVRIYAPVSQVSLKNIYGGFVNVASTSATLDKTPVTFEGVGGNTLMLFSDGTSVPTSAGNYVAVNVAEQRFSGTNRYFQSTTNGAVAIKGSLTANSLIATNLTLGSPTGPRVLSGTGSPLNVVTAPVGTLYLRTDGGAGTTLYIKETGTGTTGWVPK